MNDDRQISGSFAKLALRDLGAEVKEWPGYNAVADKLFFMADNFSTKCGSECYSAKPEEFNVLVHNNLMTKTVYTKYNKEEDLEDVILVKIIFLILLTFTDFYLFYCSMISGLVIGDLRQLI